MSWKKEKSNKRENMEKYKKYIHYRKKVKGKLSYQEYQKRKENKKLGIV